MNRKRTEIGGGLFDFRLNWDAIFVEAAALIASTAYAWDRAPGGESGSSISPRPLLLLCRM